MDGIRSPNIKKLRGKDSFGFIQKLSVWWRRYKITMKTLEGPYPIIINDSVAKFYQYLWFIKHLHKSDVFSESLLCSKISFAPGDGGVAVATDDAAGRVLVFGLRNVCLLKLQTVVCRKITFLLVSDGKTFHIGELFLPVVMVIVVTAQLDRMLIKLLYNSSTNDILVRYLGHFLRQSEFPAQGYLPPSSCRR